MKEGRATTVLCLASYFKGNAFLCAAKAAGARVVLLTVEKLLTEAWAREAVDEIFAMPHDFNDRAAMINAVSYLARTRVFDAIVPLDDYDVEVAAMLREHLRVPGMGESTVRYFRDKLAMRERSRARDVRVPDFIGVINHDEVRHFLRTVPGPWVLKPRSEAASVGIKKVHDEGEVFRLIDELGDRQSQHLIEKMIPGDVYHVDAIVDGGRVLFAAAHRYRRPLLGVIQGGGIFGTRTVARGSDDESALLAFNAQTLSALNLVRGVAHTEFIRSEVDGQLYFLETGARVGGANIAELVEETTGVNLWAEWARLEIAYARKEPYALPPQRYDHGGLMISLARDEKPDGSCFGDPEVVWRLELAHHIGLIIRAPSAERIEALFDDYERRINRDFMTSMPAPETAQH